MEILFRCPQRLVGLRMRRAGILVFKEDEELDFAGPLEGFGAAGRLALGSFETEIKPS